MILEKLETPLKENIAMLDTLIPDSDKYKSSCFLTKLLSISLVCLLVTYTLMFPYLGTKTNVNNSFNSCNWE